MIWQAAVAKLLDFQFDEAPGCDRVAGGVAGTAGTGLLRGGAVTDGDGAVWFDGLGDYAELPANPILGLRQGTVVIEFTQYAASPGRSAGRTVNAPHTLMSVGLVRGGAAAHLTISIHPDGRVCALHRGTPRHTGLTGGCIEVGTPARVAYAWGPEGSRLLVDGVEVAFTPYHYCLAGNLGPLLLGAAQVWLGNRAPNDMTGYFDGEISRFQVFDTPTCAPGQIPCFGAGTLIRTPSGPRPAETLRPGDAVLRLGGPPVSLRDVFETEVSASTLAACPDWLPVKIPRGHLNAARDLYLSRQHCVLINRGAERRLVRAEQLLRHGTGQAQIAEGKARMRYFHVLTDAHLIVWANGVPCETLRPGPLVAPSLGGSLLAPLPPCYPYADARWCQRALARSAAPHALSA